MYVILVGGPSSGKTASMNVPIRWVMKRLGTTPGIRKGHPDYPHSIRVYGLEDRHLHLITGRITPEQLFVDMRDAQRLDLAAFGPAGGNREYENALTLVTAEFGAFMQRDNHSLQIFMTDAWDGLKDELSYRTKNNGQFLIRAPALNWLAAATPSEFVNQMPENAQSQGLLSRLVPVLYDGPPIPDQLRYPEIGEDYLDALARDLVRITQLRGPIQFAPGLEAKVDREIQAGLLPQPSDPLLAEYCGRRKAHFIKTAIAVSVARSDSLIITERDWFDAKEIMFAAEADMPRVLANFGMGKAGRLAADVERHVNSLLQYRSSMPMSMLRREVLRRVSSASEVEPTIRALVDTGVIKVTENIVRAA